jgi:hypothetical protein
LTTVEASISAGAMICARTMIVRSWGFFRQGDYIKRQMASVGWVLVGHQRWRRLAVSPSSVDHDYQMVDWVYDNPRAMVAVVVPLWSLDASSTLMPARSNVSGRSYRRSCSWRRRRYPQARRQAPGFGEGAKNLVDAVFRQFTL